MRRFAVKVPRLDPREVAAVVFLGHFVQQVHDKLDPVACGS